MSLIHDQIMASLRQTDNLICLPQVFGYSMYQLGRDLVDSIEDDGWIPYILGRHDRYRSTPLASCILYLWDAGLLSPNVTETLRQRLFDIRDRMPSRETRGPRIKSLADVPAWCVSEGASVWSTSMALLALIESRTKRNRTQDPILVEAAGWLVDQQNTSTGGWPFQSTTNSTPTTPMTALALRAVCAAWTLPGTSENIRNELRASLHAGTAFLISRLVRRGREAFWEFDGQPSLTATVWALEAFRHDPRGITHDLPRQEIMSFAVSQLPAEDAEWKSECFVKEPQTKYAHQKTFYTFMPSLLPPLLEFGLSPIHPRVVRVVRRLGMAGQDEWRIKEYDMQACTFTHAMALHALVKWCVRVQTELVNGFFATNRSTLSSTTSCPVQEVNPKRCPARSRLRTARVFTAAFILSTCIALAFTPSVNEFLISSMLPIAGAVLTNIWVVTITGGIVATLIVTAFWRFYQRRRVT